MQAWLLTLVIAGATVVALFAVGNLGGFRRIVRCNQGHLYSTIWVPAASLKAVRLGSRRWQRCPVGRHWTTVRRVMPGELSASEMMGARAIRDWPVP